MFINQGGNPWPDTNVMQMVKHNNKMASFVVKVQQPLPAQKRLIVQTMHSRSYGRKMKNSLLFTMDRVISFLVLHRRCCLRCVLSLTEGEPLQGVSIYAASSENMHGVSLFTTGSTDIHSVYISIASRMEVQGVTLSTTNNINKINK
jgi:hypothetical protein